MVFRAFARCVAVWLVALLAANCWADGARGERGCAELDAYSRLGGRLGPCLLERTVVEVDVAGSVSRVTVTQEYRNPYEETVNAVYLFPLSNRGAVDRMTMKVGDRVIKGVVKERDAARREYDKAKAAGKVASLLTQERPNVFTQAVANIEPGSAVQIEISYCETLIWKEGDFEFSFPMVVGPRYVPGEQFERSPEDASRFHQTYAPAKNRTGHDVALSMKIESGVPIQTIHSHQHEIEVDYSSDKRRASVKLKGRDTIPNKDFVLSYRTANDRIQNSLLTHTDERGKYFSLTLIPPRQVASDVHIPREVVFVIDKSGSMGGFPIETAKEAMRLCIQRLHPNDTFNLVSFSGGLGNCFDEPVANTVENRRKALNYLADLHGSGGTEILNAIQTVLSAPVDRKRLRCICLMTDGYVGNDGQIIATVKDNIKQARIYAFGIGTSVNRYLLDSIAHEGRGEVEYVLSDADCRGAADRFQSRIAGPVLTDISIDTGDLPIDSIYPKKIADLSGNRPIVIKGRYSEGAKGVITVRAISHKGPVERHVTVALPKKQANNESLVSLWARARLDDLVRSDYFGVQTGDCSPRLKNSIVKLGTKYQLSTRFTSFVAVDSTRVVERAGRDVQIPLDLPAGVSPAGISPSGDSPASVAVEIISNFSERTAPRNDLMREIGALTGTGVDGRGAASRGKLVRKYGGTKGSEETVASGLTWLARQQRTDGSWSLRGKSSPSDQPEGTRYRATGLAILAFLGAGHSHMEGAHKQTVRDALNYLVKKTKHDGQKGILEDDTLSLESHAIATSAVCEAFAMTADKNLAKHAQTLLNRIVDAQDTKTGGWMEAGQSKPSLLLTFRCLSALKAGHMAYLQVPPATVKRCITFLDSVSTDEAIKSADKVSLAALVLSRTYLGKDCEDEKMVPALDALSALKPSLDQVVLNRLVTEVMFHCGGKRWLKWNPLMRDLLVESQLGAGEQKGSWASQRKSDGNHGNRDGSHGTNATASKDKESVKGSLFDTANALITLEVYYRHRRMFEKVNPEEDFPL